ncbi:MAG: enterobactin ABC transporter permease [Pseudooceanicola sp.]|nr:enterobactin ABC transporter permease [Pseudooceanicola sp.]
MSSRLLALLALLILSAAGFLFLGAEGPWAFLLPFRGAKLGALMLVGVCISTATVMFQTVTANRILTPSVLGFDALYVLVLTVLVHGLGAQAAGLVATPAMFFINLVVMTALGLGLFALLLRLGAGEMLKLVLTGIVIGIAIRSFTGFLQRMIDPAEFQLVQAGSFARFTYVDPLMLGIGALVAAPALALAWRLRFKLDVLALGPTAATGLGEPPRRVQMQALVLICVLIAVATSLAGPLVAGSSGPSNFFGLVVAALAHIATPSPRHAILMPSAALIGGCILIGGQTIMERVLHLATPLPVVIELLGGLLFLTLLLKRRAA